MCNIKKRDFFDVVSGDVVGADSYGSDASTYKRVDNVDMIFDSRGEYLGIRTSKGKFENGKYIVKKGPYDFKSFLDLKIWAGQRCSSMDFIEAKEGVFLQIDMTKRC